MLKVFFTLLILRTASGNVFLQRSELGSRDDFEDGHILGQLEQAMGSDHRVATQSRMKSITEALSPIFAALPKNNTARVGPSSARYALHRLFIQRHGWQVKGLAANGETWDAVHPSMAFADRVSSGVKALFDDRLGGSGLTLHELAVFAATLEHLIHGEAMTRLQHAYKLCGDEPMQALPKGKADKLFQTYMAIYVLGINATSASDRTMRHYVDNIRKVYPDWNLTLKFLDDLQTELVGDRPVYEFSDITDVVEEAGERFGRFQNQECVDLKKILVKLEESNGSGRVRLTDFYNSALKGGQWQFSESVQYLRQLGALDESDSSNLRVVIPNYLGAPSNCMGSSAYYGVCCIDECEDLLGHVERELKSPTADPSKIAKIIANLPSASVAAGRKLSVSLIQRLEELGDHHDNSIPIHGRLFAQWMHLAYPRECPFPHVSGTIQPKTAKEMRAEGQKSVALKEEMLQYIAGHPPLTEKRERCSNDICSAMWSSEEELVDVHAHLSERTRGERRGQWRTLVFSIFSCTAAVCFAVCLVRTTALIRVADEMASKAGKAGSGWWAQASLKQTRNIQNV